MACIITHSVVSGAAANPNYDVDGPAWDANHVITGSPDGAFVVTDFGAVGDGTTNDYTAFADALAAIYANKGGTLVVPYTSTGYVLGTSLVVDVGQYVGGSGITIELNGNIIAPSHTGWCFDVKTNFFGTNNGGIFGKKVVNIHGNGANINTSNAAATGAIRIQDCVAFRIDSVAINSYSAGTAIELFITTSDLSTWVEYGEISNIRGAGNLIGLYTKSSNSTGSFLGNVFRSVTFGGGVTNMRLFKLEGLLYDCLFLNCGGYYNQSGGTGGNGFYLDGGFTGTSFVNPYIDIGGTGTQSALTDIVFGSNYTATTQYQPVLVNALEIDLPIDWRTRLLVVGPINSTGVLSNYASGNPREVLRAARTYYVNASTGSDTTKDGLSSGNPFATVSNALSVVFGTLDCAGFQVTIQLADATYTTPIVIQGNPVGIGNSALVIQGTTSGGAIISVTSNDAVTVKGGAIVTLSNMTLQAATSGNGVNVDQGSQLTISSGVQFGACATRSVFQNGKSIIYQNSAVTWTGNAPIGIGLVGASVYYKNAAITISNRTFSDTFAKIGENSNMQVNDTTFTHASTTGSSYYAYAGALIQTFSSSTSLFTGTVGFAEAGQFAQYL